MEKIKEKWKCDKKQKVVNHFVKYLKPIQPELAYLVYYANRKFFGIFNSPAENVVALLITF